jgi:hypothetical protein
VVLTDPPLRKSLQWPDMQRKAQREQEAKEERDLFRRYGPACVECEMVLLLPERPVRCSNHHCNALLHGSCWAAHAMSCSDSVQSLRKSDPAEMADALPKKQKLSNNLSPSDSTHSKPYAHVSPPPPPWSHNGCGPESIQEVGGVLLRCVDGLRPLLLPATTKQLDTLAMHRNQDARITEDTPWQLVHKCPCRQCVMGGVTTQDNYAERELYKHMNRNRTLQDETFEALGPYTVGSFTDVRRMFEAYLGLRTMAHPHHALPGLGLCVVNTCMLCGVTTRPPGMLQVSASGIGRAFPGMPKTCTTQQMVDQAIGKCSLLDHLPEDKATHLATVKRYGERCPAQCTNTEENVWTDTMLPTNLDSQQPLPPLLRVTKGLYNDRLSAVSDTITVEHNAKDVTYKLLAIVYGNTQHFTACIRYHIDEGNEQFYHFDPFHFERDRLLPLSRNLPACMGGKPAFQSHHTKHMRDSFLKNTHLRNVATAIYGIVPCPQQDGEEVPTSDETVMMDSSAEPSRPSSMRDCEECVAEKKLQLNIWSCPYCTYDNASSQSVCVICANNRPPAPIPFKAEVSWTCPSCTYHNRRTNTLCVVCATDQPAPLWTCSSCTYDNPWKKQQCAVCTAERGAAALSSPPDPSTSATPPRTASAAPPPTPPSSDPYPSTPLEAWTCPSCTFEANAIAELICGVCGTEQP